MNFKFERANKIELQAQFSGAGTNLSLNMIFTPRVHSFSILSQDRSKASSKTMPPHSAIQSFLLQMRVSSPVFKVIQ